MNRTPFLHSNSLEETYRPVAEVLSRRTQPDRVERVGGVREDLSVKVESRLRPEGRMGVSPGEEGEHSLQGIACEKALRQG